MTLARSFVVRILVLGVLAACSHGSMSASATGSAASDEDLANEALDVISGTHPTPHDNYMVAVCRSARVKELSTDTTLGPFVRHMAVVKSTIAVVVAPTGFSDEPIYVVYFDDRGALGLAAFEAGAARRGDADVARAYVPMTTPVVKRKRVAAYQSAKFPLDEGAIDVLRIVGWK